MSEWYEGWVGLHCTATGADARTRDALLANRDLALTIWRATAAELGEVTNRLVAACRTPKFANEHSDAVGVELQQLREERSRADRPAPPGDFAPDCEACGGSGLAVVPHRRCVWEGRLVLHPDQRAVVTVAVLCTRCPAGERAVAAENPDRRRPLLSRVEAHHRCDVVRLLREYERSRAADARKHPGTDEWRRLVASIMARAA